MMRLDVTPARPLTPTSSGHVRNALLKEHLNNLSVVPKCSVLRKGRGDNDKQCWQRCLFQGAADGPCPGALKMSLPRVWSVVCTQVRARAGAYLRPRGAYAARRQPRRRFYKAVPDEAVCPSDELVTARDPATAQRYATLELAYGASAEAIRAARWRLLRAYHPDRFPHDPDRARTAYALVQKLNEAHDELLNSLETRRDD